MERHRFDRCAREHRLVREGNDVHGALLELPNHRWLYRSGRVVDGRRLMVGYTGSTPGEAMRAFDLAASAGRAGTHIPAGRSRWLARFLPIPRALG